MSKISFLFFLVAAGIFFSCQEKTAKPANNSVKEKEQEKDAFEMYQMSQMAAFMETMSAEHTKMKQAILNGNPPDTLNYDLEKLTTANFTNPEDRDAEYLELAEAFKAYELKMIAEPNLAKQHFNQAVNTCITCHESKCTGPLTRIKKLLIQ